MKVLGRRNLILVGFMGVGKNKVGKEIAHILGREFVDLDAIIVNREGMSINDIFTKFGEPYFRSVEADELAKLCRRLSIVIATGGGAFCQPENAELMLETGVVVWLNVEFAIIRKRLAGKTDRPNWHPEKAKLLFEKRLPLYARADFEIPVKAEAPAEEIAQRVVATVRTMGGFAQ